ncbi:DUF1488 family protein [Paraburkholderia gardini]|uniref:DUF1488 family protein n=1 Tax=Paraburkholderia gardini TaxID=2823469 RepID=A0ABN7QMI7_9BURK|nr:DUF1488 family protein [Paraburkholderia gardini]CAG4898239.1 hypothetical protein R54767_02361 [Paraburkholderia gardini]CAG4898597.1 hypothetical protein R69919_02488 [Paraburkholderia gardini]
METVQIEPSISPDRRAVIFVLSLREKDHECSITREALEQHFWLQPGASEARILRTFNDGRKRIFAVAERKLLANPGGRVVVTASDFGTRR